MLADDDPGHSRVPEQARPQDSTEGSRPGRHGGSEATAPRARCRPRSRPSSCSLTRLGRHGLARDGRRPDRLGPRRGTRDSVGTRGCCTLHGVPSVAPSGRRLASTPRPAACSFVLREGVAIDVVRESEFPQAPQREVRGEVVAAHGQCPVQKPGFVLLFVGMVDRLKMEPGPEDEVDDLHRTSLAAGCRLETMDRDESHSSPGAGWRVRLHYVASASGSPLAANYRSECLFIWKRSRIHAQDWGRPAGEERHQAPATWSTCRSL